ncbi:hypothetical protein I312_100191 [Cryptococcus bacillisporus CA1280]|uniref:Ysc84 actin-binding domain-containing protein n=1 Tax=Cryptococcus bacillisporus CA1280 TaxID=1296109 RepID=A0A0D0VTB1_CRYGA|nr:hypothetical protein I312_00784 [Cryptococcus bacillisporus CA1280]
MSNPPPPPPRRTYYPSASSLAPDPSAKTWKDKVKAKGSIWGKYAMDKGVKVSDNLGGKVNDLAERRFGTEAFWPVTGDFPKEMDKCARILRAFTVDGIITEEKEDKDASGSRKKKVIRKIPPAIIAKAKGLAIFTSMRSGIAPFGGAGGAGVVVAKLPDGTWSAPASISPNNLSTGFLLGVDVYDCVLVINTQKALDSFKTHKATIGAELAVAAGPYGAGAAVEAGLEKAPLFSYVRSRGMYAGVEIVGQVFVERYEENGAMYHWPDIKAGDILNGKVKIPVEAASLHKALKDAESGKAQKEKGNALDIVIPEGATQLELNDGEVLKLPPTPDQTTGREQESDPETEKVLYPSRPGSHNPSFTSVDKISRGHSPVSEGPTHESHFSSSKLAVPPPLPTRRPKRPSLEKNRSSTSNYSEEANNAAPASSLETDVPPSYAEAYVNAAAGTEDPEERWESSLDDTKGEQMSAAEKKEWEQHLAEQKTQGGPLPESLQDGIVEGELSDRLQNQVLGYDEKDTDSLR